MCVWGVQYLLYLQYLQYLQHLSHSGLLLLMLLTTATTAGNGCRWGRRISERILDPQPNSSQLYVNCPSAVQWLYSVQCTVYSILISSVSVRAGAGAGLDSGLSQHQSTTVRSSRETAAAAAHIVEHGLRTSEIIQ